MPRLVAFGCSHTYGESLPDCITNDPPPPPSKFSWPNMLSKKLPLGIDKCMNLAHCGSSNKQIHFKILKSNFEKDDLVVVLWTHVDRSCFLTDKGLKQMLPSYTQKRKDNPKQRRIENVAYYEHLYSKENAEYETFVSIDHAYRYLNTFGVKQHHFTFSRKGVDPISSTLDKTPDWFSPALKNLDLLPDLGYDNHHPGVKAHADMADQIYKHIEETK